MKKFITILSLLLIAALQITAQNPFVKDGEKTYLKANTDKVGIGTITPAEKLTVVSLSGETILGLKGYPTQSNPYIKLMNSNGTAIWGLYAKTDWWTIGSTLDSTAALLSAKIAKGWLRINGTLSGIKLIATSYTVNGSITGNALVRGTGTFSTDASGSRNLYARIKISGVVSGDVFVVTPLMASNVAKPGAGEQLGWYATTDSLIVSRQTATTAGLTFSYIRIK